MPTTNDACLWYNVGDWGKYGLAVPNWSDDQTSQNESIRNLVSVIGRNTQAIMWSPDARMRQPPSINTVVKIHKMCVRARQIMSGRALAPNEPMMESVHALPAPEQFLVYPTPYFKVRNSWMKSYAGFALMAMTEAMQHSENARPLEITTAFTSLVGQYLYRIYKRLGSELLGLDPDIITPTYTFTDADLKGYKPETWFTSTEMIDTVPSLTDWPTEDTLKPLTDGIPVVVLPELGPWPVGGGGAIQGPQTSPASNTASFGAGIAP